MAAPQFAPTPVIDTARAYSSPAVVPASWSPDRPGDLTGFQPSGACLGYQGPDQGFALKIAAGFKPRLRLERGEHAADAIRGCFGIALRRASLFSRAPVVHDLTVAFTAWGFLADAPPELVKIRRELFAGLSHGYYTEGRGIADSIPEATLRMTPQQVTAAFPSQWRQLLGR